MSTNYYFNILSHSYLTKQLMQCVGDANCTFVFPQRKKHILVLQCGVHCVVQPAESCIASYYNQVVGLVLL